jgi:hypothetical protein
MPVLVGPLNQSVLVRERPRNSRNQWEVSGSLFAGQSASDLFR